MGLLTTISDPLTLISLIIMSTAVAVIGQAIYNVFLHPLAHIPGPLYAKLTPFWLYYHSYIGDESSTIHLLHRRYGPYLRVAPNDVDISDADAIQPIYVAQGGFPKADCYRNFDIDGHCTIFSALDPSHRAPRAKTVVPLFSTAAIRANGDAITACVDRMVSRLRTESLSKRPVNVLNLARSLAVDIVSTHLFQQNYDGTSEKSPRLSVTPFVDAFVAVGRRFYLPNSVFTLTEWVIDQLFPDKSKTESMDLVERFVDDLANSTTMTSGNYPGRLMRLGLCKTEVKSQCKDLIFAGTDSTGSNLANICRQLAMHPELYEKLRAEINENQAPGQDLQSLPYLSAVVKEALRTSMANPTRLPHVVPPGAGLAVNGVHLPPGSIVGCSAFELHYNGDVFPDPYSFRPERWLTEDKAEKDRMSRHHFAFGAGSRACIARNLATIELFMATEALVRSDVLRGARPSQEEVEIFEWFNSSVKGGSVELIWDD